MKKIIILLIFFFGSLTIIFGQQYYFSNLNKKIVQENNFLQSGIKKINSDIKLISEKSSEELDNSLSKFKFYFKESQSFEILNLFGIIEYLLPTNNFISSINLGKKSININLSFQSDKVKELIKLNNNLQILKRGFVMEKKKGYILTPIGKFSNEELKELKEDENSIIFKNGLIKDFSLGNIKLEPTGELKMDSIKKYKLIIKFSPNLDKTEIVKFLSNIPGPYRNIYKNTLKFVKESEDGKKVKKENEIKEVKKENEKK